MPIVTTVPTLWSVLSFSSWISFASCHLSFGEQFSFTFSFTFVQFTFSFTFQSVPCLYIFLSSGQGGAVLLAPCLWSAHLHPLVRVQCSSLSQWRDAIGSTLELLTSHFHTYPVCARSNAGVAAVGLRSCLTVWQPVSCLALSFQCGAHTCSSVFPIHCSLVGIVQSWTGMPVLWSTDWCSEQSQVKQNVESTVSKFQNHSNQCFLEQSVLRYQW